MVQVTSCRFMRISCSEDDHPLFRRYYARSNRERGVKLLRCFPHCCPEHVQRCYCGSSVHVLVTFAAELSAATKDKLVVCARFEPSRVTPLWPTRLTDPLQDDEDANERKLRPGEFVSLPASLLRLSRCNRRVKPAVWIRADREGESKQTTKNAVLYVLNNHRFPRWLYSYDSSVTRTQREMTHHLVVYVLQLTGSRSQLDEVDAAVLARHESPGFSLVSYRRSGNNANDAGCDLPAIEVTSDSRFAAVDVDMTRSSSSATEMDAQQRSLYNLSQQRSERFEPKVETTHGAFQTLQSSYHQRNQQQVEVREPTPPEKRLQSCQWPRNFNGSLSGSEQDNASWQQGVNARNCGFREKGQHLLILWRFLRAASLSDVGLGADTADVHVRPHWLRAAAILRESSMTSSSRELECVVAAFLHGILSTSSCKGTTPPRDAAVIRATAHLFLRALVFHNVQNLFCSACTGRTSASSKAQRQERFVLLVSGVHDAFHDVLHEVSAEQCDPGFGNQNPSLPALVDEVLSIVYAQPRFSAVRAQVSALLLRQQVLSDALNGWFKSFIALTRERMISPTNKPTQQELSRIRPEDDDMLWNQRWLLQPGSLQIVGVAPGDARDVFHDLHLLDITQMIYEFGCVDIVVEENASCLSMRSALSLFHATPTAPMTLVLDGRLRVFRVLPSGLSSMIATTGGWVVGDYRAVLSDDAHSVQMHFFGFAEGEDDEIPMRRVSLSIQLEEELSEEKKATDPRGHFAFVHGTVYGSTYLLARAGVNEQMEKLTLSETSSLERMEKLTLSETSSLERAAIWREAQWAPLYEVQAGLIAARWVCLTG